MSAIIMLVLAVIMASISFGVYTQSVSFGLGVLFTLAAVGICIVEVADSVTKALKEKG
ncbi:MAG: hypothetical protein V4474_03145 [Patescibacteria group bacterium]